MQIVTDGSADLTPPQLQGIDLHIVPQNIELDGKIYRTGVDVDSDGFYALLTRSKGFPTTSEPPVERFLEAYQRIVATGETEILSLHLSSALGKVYANAREAAMQVRAARITLVDTRTLSGALGWQVEAAARAVKAGWTRDEIMPLLKLIGDRTDIFYTLSTLRYLVHGGRISHLRGLVGSMLDLKPIITIDKQQGTNEQAGAARTMQRAVLGIVEALLQKYERGSELRIQIMHGQNAEMADLLTSQIGRTFRATFLPTGTIAPVLGAHAGPGLVGVVAAPQDVFARLPWERERV